MEKRPVNRDGKHSLGFRCTRHASWAKGAHSPDEVMGCKESAKGASWEEDCSEEAPE